MIKKVIAIVACCSILAVTVLAAYGSVVCEVSGHGYSQPTGGNTGYDVFEATARASESSASASNIQNIYAKAEAVRDDGVIIEAAEALDHYTTSVRAQAPDVTYPWSSSEVWVNAVGTARTRYVNGSVDEDYRVGSGGPMGGRYNRSQSEVQENYVLGSKSENAMKQVAKEMFSNNLDNYTYIPMAELVNNKNPDATQSWLKSIITDYIDSNDIGDSIPLGVLYQDNQAFTIHKMADGNVYFTEYSMSSNLKSENSNKYTIVNSVAKIVDQTLLKDLYPY